MRTHVEIFGDLLDRSIEQIAAVAADARDFDAARISRLADIWDNNTLPCRGGRGRGCAGWRSAALAGRG
ncbi:hypothetical protein F4553_001267 [Allocatelliglobosispora scoriae]|uniref:Uncharacterized protein n=1 Tax=Allocatelliglobosispora scoriae TaxID=643052 RepID=A0A841BKK0_9ACTN|nr:hypothetical protein [Allocatelliglobosispora scoriae]MBB5867888.1 hypothetical protein [Allocatelliglobosispora scoriae]